MDHGWVGSIFKQIELLEQKKGKVRKKCEDERQRHEKRGGKERVAKLSGLLRLHDVRFNVLRDRNGKWIHMK